MKTIFYTASSLDGYIATPEHSLDWLFQFGEVETSYPSFIQGIGALAMGSSTYRWILRHEGHLNPQHPKPWGYSQPTWVFSSRNLPVVPGAPITFVSGDVRPVHAVMAAAAEHKNLWIVGGGGLAAQFHAQGLLDEIIVQIAPVILGGGAPLFPALLSNPPLRLVSVTALGGIFVELRYEVPRAQGEVFDHSSAAG